MPRPRDTQRGARERGDGCGRTVTWSGELHGVLCGLHREPLQPVKVQVSWEVGGSDENVKVLGQASGARKRAV